MTFQPDPSPPITGLEWKQLSTAQRLEILKEIGGEDLSATQIANVAYRQYGFEITRNVVIGAANRAGLSLPGFKPKAPKPKRPPERKTGVCAHRSTKSQPLPEMDTTAKGKPVSFMEVTNQTCRWPVSGDPGPEMMCCGAPTMILESGLRHSYCAFHRKLGTGQGTQSERRAVRRYQSKHSVSRAGVMDL